MPWTAHIDGGSRGNPGPAAAGVVLRDDSGRKTFAAGFFLGRLTNNQAEYQGLLSALRLLEKARARQIEIVSDSELMVRQINGHYKVRSPELRPLYEEAMSYLAGFQWRMRHTLREGNTDADALANEAMDAGGDVVRLDAHGLLNPTRPTQAREQAATPRREVEGVIATPPAGGQCPAALRKGQKLSFAGGMTPSGLCLHLCAAAAPTILQMIADHGAGQAEVRCSKPTCGAVLGLRAVGDQPDRV